VPVIYTPHGHIFAKEAHIPGVPSAGPKRWILKAFRRAAHRHAQITVAVNERDRDDHVKLRLCPSAKIRIIHNGIDTAHFVPFEEAERLALRESLGVSPEAKVIGFAARLTSEKGVEDLLEVARGMREH